MLTGYSSGKGMSWPQGLGLGWQIFRIGTKWSHRSQSVSNNLPANFENPTWELVGELGYLRVVTQFQKKIQCAMQPEEGSHLGGKSHHKQVTRHRELSDNEQQCTRLWPLAEPLNRSKPIILDRFR